MATKLIMSRLVQQSRICLISLGTTNEMFSAVYFNHVRFMYVTFYFITGILIYFVPLML